MPIYSKTTKKVYRKKAPAKKEATKAQKKIIKKVVNQELDKKAELKSSTPIGFNNQQMSSYNLTGPVAPTVLDVASSTLAQIVQGVGQGDRIGNEIRLKRMPFKLIMLNQELTPKMVRFLIVKLKDSIEPPLLADFQFLLQDGNSSLPPDNLALQQFLNINKDFFEVKRQWRFILQGTTQPTAYPGYNQMKVISCDLAKYCPKNVVYNDTTAQATNVGLYAFALMANLDGSALNDAQVSNSWTCHAEYTDL